MAIKAIDNIVGDVQQWNTAEYRLRSNLEEIRGLAPEWDDLVAKAECNKAFASLEWYLASCRLDTSATPYVITATTDGEMTCIVPLVLNQTLGVAMFPHYANDYNDVLVQSGNYAPVADLLRYAMSADNRCRHLKLSDLRPESHCLAALPYLRQDPNIECRHSVIDYHYYVDLPSSFEAYLASRGKIFRKSIRRSLRAVAARNGLTIRELCPDNLRSAELPDIFFKLFLCRHSRIASSRQAQFHLFAREVLPPLFQKGSVRVFALIEEGRMIAVELIFVAAKGFLTWNSGFLTGKEHWSPGNCLDAFAIKQAIAEGLHEFDFGSGDEAYKLHWTNHEYTVSEVELMSKC